MLTQRKEGAEKLEGMAKSKGLKFTGLKNMKTSSKIALVILVAVVLISILAPIIAPYDPYAIGMARQAPDAAHIFGTDDKGRDILSRILYGGRISLVIGFGSVLFALVLGSIVGALAAVSRKAVSEVIMRILDIIMSVPGIALAAVLVTILGNSVPAIIFSIGFKDCVISLYTSTIVIIISTTPSTTGTIRFRRISALITRSSCVTPSFQPVASRLETAMYFDTPS